jgi:hypothetical protein
MAVTNLLDERKIKEELAVFLKNQNILSTTDRGVATVTQEFNGTGAQVDFIATSVPLRNVRSVTVGGVASVYGSDYTVNYSTATVTFAVAPASGSNNVDIQYDHGTSEKIFTDQPRYDLKVGSYPRIAVTLTSSTTQEIALGGKDTMTEFIISATAYGFGTVEVDNYIKAIRSAVLLNKANFYHIDFLTPMAGSPIINDPGRVDKILQKTIDFRAPNNIETAS